MKKINTLNILFLVALFLMHWSASNAQTCNNVSGFTFNATLGTSAVADPVNYNFLTGTQMGRLFRDGTASTCAAPKACPGDFNTGSTYNFDSYTFVNTSPNPECIQIDFNTSTCGTNVHPVAFLGAYVPPAGAGQLCGGNTYLGDIGSSATQPFEVTVPGGATFTLAMSNTSGQAVCDYSFTLNPVTPGVVISAVGCTAPPAPIPTMGEWGLIILALLTLTLGAVSVMSRQTALAGAGGGNASVSLSRLPFERNSFMKMLAGVMVGIAVVFAVAVFAFGYEMTSADVPGSLLAAPVAAYLLHLVFGTKKD